jgi:uncharacterized protein YjiK
MIRGNLPQALSDPSPEVAVQEYPSGYDLSHPVLVHELPAILQEVSGLTDIDREKIACVQDEDGTVFIYDLVSGAVSREIKFGGAGDYEGITRAGNNLYVLRSDGELFELVDFQSDKLKINTYDLKLPIKESEGLGFDPVNHRLLIAAKDEAKDDAYAGQKVVFGFDLDSKRRSTEPVLMFPFDEGENGGIHPSGIAIHPLTGRLYVLSSKNHSMYVFRGNGEVVNIYELPKERFAQPEGITFLDNGDLLISNEGKKKESANLMRFHYSIPEN